MVTKEQLVCTKEQALALKDKGAPSRTIFEYVSFTDIYGMGWVVEESLGGGVPAYTTAEMLDILPEMGKIKRFLFIWKTNLEPVKVAKYLINHLQ